MPVVDSSDLIGMKMKARASFRLLSMLAVEHSLSFDRYSAGLPIAMHLVIGTPSQCQHGALSFAFQLCTCVRPKVASQRRKSLALLCQRDSFTLSRQASGLRELTLAT